MKGLPAAPWRLWNIAECSESTGSILPTFFPSQRHDDMARRHQGFPCWPGQCPFPLPWRQWWGRIPIIPTTAVTTRSPPPAPWLPPSVPPCRKPPSTSISATAARSFSRLLLHPRDRPAWELKLLGFAPPKALHCCCQRQRRHLNVLIVSHNFQCLGADGAGGTQYRNLLHMFIISLYSPYLERNTRKSPFPYFKM